MGMPNSVSQDHAEPKAKDLFLQCVSTVDVSRMGKARGDWLQSHAPESRKPSRLGAAGGM